MKARILLVSTYPELTLTAQNFARQMQLQLDIHNGGILSDGHRYAKRMQEEYDVIISQGGTVASIQALVTKPVVAVKLTVTDFLLGFIKARQYGDPLALMCYKSDVLHELETIARMLPDLNYKIFPYSNKEEFVQQAETVFALERHTIVGLGSCTDEYARKNNLNYVLIRSTMDNVRAALVAARNIVELGRKEKLRASRLENLINYSTGAILSIDRDKVVKTCNAAAATALQTSPETLVGKHIHDPGVPRALRTLYGDGTRQLACFLNAGTMPVMANRIPLTVDEECHETLVTFQNVKEIQRLETRARMELHAKGLRARHTFEDFIGQSPLIGELLEKARRFSNTDASILVEGETGTGKELMVQSIHNASPRREGPFVAVNCAALPENLLESELFGYEGGAFTGARKGGKLGLFELAHNGTIFLDEIGEISPNIQGRLLRVLQEKEIMRVGGDRVINVDARIIAATNKNLYAMIEAGKFRNDLYFRLNILTVRIPALRQRHEDIPGLVAHFCRQCAALYGTRLPRLHKKTLRLLQDYSWPGNVRELRNLMEKTAILYTEGSDVDALVIANLHDSRDQHQSRAQPESSDSISVRIGNMKDMQTEIMEKVLERHGGNRRAVADELGLSRVTVWKKLGGKE